jgi:hypothetical protein
MTLKSAFEDLSDNTLSALTECLKKLEYLGGLRKSRGDYWHWGFSKLHGQAAARNAFQEAHHAAVSQVLSTPLRALLDDAKLSSAKSGMDAEEYLEKLGKQEAELLPSNPGAGSARHLSSVLHALLGLERNRKSTAIPRAASPPQPLDQSLRHPGDSVESAAEPETRDEAEE